MNHSTVAMCHNQLVVCMLWTATFPATSRWMHNCMFSGFWIRDGFLHCIQHMQ